MGYCTLTIEFFWLKNYTSYYYINSFSLLRIFFFSHSLCCFFFFSHLRCLFSFFSFFLSSLLLLFFSHSLCCFSKKKKKKKKRDKVGERKKRAAGMFLNLREKKKIKERVGWVEICWTCVWRRKTRKKKKKKKKWKRMHENDLNERKNNIKNKKS